MLRAVSLSLVLALTASSSLAQVVTTPQGGEMFCLSMPKALWKKMIYSDENMTEAERTQLEEGPEYMYLASGSKEDAGYLASALNLRGEDELNVIEEGAKLRIEGKASDASITFSTDKTKLVLDTSSRELIREPEGVRSALIYSVQMSLDGKKDIDASCVFPSDGSFLGLK